MSLAPALASMGRYNQWINWIEIPATPKSRKVPSDPITRKAINPHDSRHWMSYEQAAATGLNIGFVFTEADPFFFIDLDEPPVDGDWSDHSKSIVSQFPGAAVEVSTSGKGLHIIGCASYLPNRRATWKTDGGVKVEAYQTLRFMALGSGAIGDTWLDHTAALDAFLPMQEDAGDAGTGDGPVPEWDGTRDDDRLIEGMLRAKPSAAVVFSGKASIQDLWEANEEALGVSWPDPSEARGFDHSSADAALMTHLAFWTGKDHDRMDRLFRRSGLMRDKYGKRSEYRRDTITGACGKVSNVYTRGDPLHRNDNKPGSEVGTYMTFEDQRKHFEGCVYVRDRHRVFTPDGSLTKAEAFNVMYGGHQFQMSSDNAKPTYKAFEAFTESRGIKFPKAHNTCFRPEHESGSIITDGNRDLINVYVPAVIKRKQGDATPFTNHVAKLLPDPSDQAIFYAYVAALVQYPGIKFQWTMVIQGAEGNGKTAILKCIEHAVGTQYTHYPAAKDLANQFNAWVDRTLFAGVEEVYTSDRREVIDALKPLITNSRIEIQYKGVDQTTGDNRVNFVMCTNHRDAILKTKNDRRYCIMFTPQQSYEDCIRDGMGQDYFPNFWKWLNDDGYAIVAEFLHTYPIPDALNPATSCHRAPSTSTTDQVIAESRGNIEQALSEAIGNEQVGFCGGWISSHVLDQFFRSYKLGYQKRKELLEGMDYVLHPALNQGRATMKIPFEEGKRPKLYVLKGSLPSQITDATAATAAYMKAQGYSDMSAVPGLRG